MIIDDPLITSDPRNLERTVIRTERAVARGGLPLRLMSLTPTYCLNYDQGLYMQEINDRSEAAYVTRRRMLASMCSHMIRS